MDEKEVRKIIREEIVREMSKDELEAKLQKLEYHLGTEVVEVIRRFIPFKELSPNDYLKVIRALQLIINAVS